MTSVARKEGGGGAKLRKIKCVSSVLDIWYGKQKSIYSCLCGGEPKRSAVYNNCPANPLKKNRPKLFDRHL